MIEFFSEVHEQAILSCDAIHRERRILLKQEIGRMVLFFTDQPSLLAPNIQVSFFLAFWKHEKMVYLTIVDEAFLMSYKFYSFTCTQEHFISQ